MSSITDVTLTISCRHKNQNLTAPREAPKTLETAILYAVLANEATTPREKRTNIIKFHSTTLYLQREWKVAQATNEVTQATNKMKETQAVHTCKAG